jgi:structure-specific recognition protein 1
VLPDAPPLFRLEDISHVTPRGNFNLDFHTDYLLLVAKDKTITIPYNTITVGFNLPKVGSTSKVPDKTVVFILNKAITVGKQEHTILVMQPKNVKASVKPEIKVEDGSDVSTQLGALKWLFDAGCNIKLCEPDRGAFYSTNSLSYLKCYNGVKDGVLYPLKEGMLFLSPPVFVAKSEIVSIASNRSGARTFDISILKSNSQKVEFNMIESQEQNSLVSYVTYSKFKAKLDSDKENTDTKVDGEGKVKGEGSDTETEEEEEEGEEGDSDEDDESFVSESDALSYGSGGSDGEDDSGTATDDESTGKGKVKVKVTKKVATSSSTSSSRPPVTAAPAPAPVSRYVSKRRMGAPVELVELPEEALGESDESAEEESSTDDDDDDDDDGDDGAEGAVNEDTDGEEENADGEPLAKRIKFE